ncbi:DUF397 domain-containing protein [Actinomadura logoneensis]|uniref:DUF397 domain-containing protein n=1 Tax=Actinomadura logoneensis TaxID=2293572 RepID=A0A372JS03_9ACTN|nr:DUF397 domain-containing protein [Actinomadura logoneensis]RFU42802.1 DUF397 domain-containing protein [Actinomadura logoneensis]
MTEHAHRWRKSSYSGGTASSDCVEVAALGAVVGIRDSKAPDEPHLGVSQGAFRGLLSAVRGRHD